MTNRHISSNIRLIFDLLHYSYNIDNDSLVVFLDFYKSFNTVEYYFIFTALKTFGFGPNFVSTIKMFYKNIHSCVILYSNTTKRFPVMRSVREDCPISPFFILDCG